MRFTRSLFAALVALLSLPTFAKDYSGEIHAIENKVQKSFGSNSQLVSAVNAIAVAPIMREMISHSPMTTTLLLETDNTIPPTDRSSRRMQVLEKLKAITETPYELIHLNDLELESRFSAAKMRELLLQRLATIVAKDAAVHVAIVLPDLAASAGSMMTLKSLYEVLEERKFVFTGQEGIQKTYCLEDIDVIFFAESDHSHIPAAFVSRMNHVATIDLNDCELYLRKEGK